MQAVRYFVAFKVFKGAESVFGAVTCCSGCFSAYRRAAIMPRLDWWEHQTFFGRPSTFGDDRSLTNCVLRSWRVKQTSVGLSAIVLPVCRGTGSFVFWRIWVDPSGAALLDQWLASVRPTAWREPPICAELDP